MAIYDLAIASDAGTVDESDSAVGQHLQRSALDVGSPSPGEDLLRPTPGSTMVLRIEPMGRRPRDETNTAVRQIADVRCVNIFRSHDMFTTSLFGLAMRVYRLEENLSRPKISASWK